MEVGVLLDFMWIQLRFTFLPVHCFASLLCVCALRHTGLQFITLTEQRGETRQWCNLVSKFYRPDIRHLLARVNTQLLRVDAQLMPNGQNSIVSKKEKIKAHNNESEVMMWFWEKPAYYLYIHSEGLGRIHFLGSDSYFCLLLKLFINHLHLIHWTLIKWHCISHK